MFKNPNCKGSIFYVLRIGIRDIWKIVFCCIVLRDFSSKLSNDLK